MTNKYLEMKVNGATDLEVTAQMKADGLTQPWQRAEAWGVKMTPMVVSAEKVANKPSTKPVIRRSVVKLSDVPTKDLLFSMQKHGAKKVTIIADLTKTHFKALMSLLKGYDSKTKTGLVSNIDIEKLKDLIEKMELSSAKVAERSHKKAIEKVSAKKAGGTMDFEEYVSEFLDQQVCLMSESDRAEAFKSFQKL